MPLSTYDTSLRKLRRAVSVRAVQRAAGVGIVLPVGDVLDTLLPTAIYLSVVSLLDEALVESVQAKCGRAETRDMYSRIELLEAGKHLGDAARLHKIRVLRNQVAHEPGRYASWSDVDELFRAVDDELQHLGLSSGGNAGAPGSFG